MWDESRCGLLVRMTDAHGIDFSRGQLRMTGFLVQGEVIRTPQEVKVLTDA